MKKQSSKNSPLTPPEHDLEAQLHDLKCEVDRQNGEFRSTAADVAELQRFFAGLREPIKIKLPRAARPKKPAP